MYNFSGIICKIWTCDGLIMIGSIITIILHKPWVDGWGQKKVKYCLIAFAFGLFLMGYHISIILNPEVQKYTGEYVKVYSGKGVFYDYHFENEEKKISSG